MMLQVLALCVLGFSAASACGGAESGESGMFNSPNWPSYYPTDVTCVWTITTPEGTSPKLEFDSFDIERSSGCSYDSVVIRDGDSADAPILATACGRRAPGPITATGNTLYVELISDDSEPKRGFNANWVAV